jgi:hypothetical protein
VRQSTEAVTFEVRVMGDGRYKTRTFTDQWEAEREYKRLMRAKLRVTLACRLPRPNAA